VLLSLKTPEQVMRESRGGPSGWTRPVGCERTGPTLTEFTKARLAPVGKKLVQPVLVTAEPPRTAKLVAVPSRGSVAAQDDFRQGRPDHHRN
jgi:hypothetical protein